MIEFSIKEKNITIWNEEYVDVPVIYLNTVIGNGKEVLEEYKKIGKGKFILVVIGNLNWDDDMTPWYMHPLNEKDRECLGKSKEYLNILVNDIKKEVEKNLKFRPKENIIAGYSLAGLFALWSLYNTDIFRKAICCSSSFWYVNFKEYVKENNFMGNVDAIYFSLGDREKESSNKYLKTVEDNTKLIYNNIKEKNINTIFELNNGNHFKEANLRLAKGIKWILDNK